MAGLSWRGATNLERKPIASELWPESSDDRVLYPIRCVVQQPEHGGIEDISGSYSLSWENLMSRI